MNRFFAVRACPHAHEPFNSSRRAIDACLRRTVAFALKGFACARELLTVNSLASPFVDVRAEVIPTSNVTALLL